MASDESMMTFQSSFQDEEFDDDDDVFDHHHLHQHEHHPHPHNLSRLSVCTSSTLCDVDDDVDVDVDNAMSMYVSQLSIESFDADGEFSDTKEEVTPQGLTLSSDSENEVGSCYSLPATPPRKRSNNNNNHVGYASDNEVAQKGVVKTKNNDPMRSRSRRTRRGNNHSRWGVNSNNSLEGSKKSMKKKKEEEHVMVQGFISGESDQSVGGGSNGTGVMVITRPKGGRRSLCMDLEEVKACRDLGFELEHERMLDTMPSHLSFSNSTLDTSSGGTSPIANWRISAPGDDPRDVKARLKVWAQAVAIASTSKYGT
ncbi:hypothetical protein RIF29_24682 [Crotalaria pallida]|uniref:Uncharacterized protein n=1 Tax=Crotalaria pallida TaxID=3830 RepID=A0AAN9EKZ4_CROPI